MPYALCPFSILIYQHHWRHCLEAFYIACWGVLFDWLVGFFFFKTCLFLYVCLPVWVYAQHIQANVEGRVTGSCELPGVVLGTEPVSSRKAASALSHETCLWACFWNRVSLSRPVWPWTYINLPSSPSQVLALKVWAIMPSCIFCFCYKLTKITMQFFINVSHFLQTKQTSFNSEGLPCWALEWFH